MSVVVQVNKRGHRQYQEPEYIAIYKITRRVRLTSCSLPVHSTIKDNFFPDDHFLGFWREEKRNAEDQVRTREEVMKK